MEGTDEVKKKKDKLYFRQKKERKDKQPGPIKQPWWLVRKFEGGSVYHPSLQSPS